MKQKIEKIEYPELFTIATINSHGKYERAEFAEENIVIICEKINEIIDVLNKERE